MVADLSSLPCGYGIFLPLTIHGRRLGLTVSNLRNNIATPQESAKGFPVVEVRSSVMRNLPPASVATKTDAWVDGAKIKGEESLEFVRKFLDFVG